MKRALYPLLSLVLFSTSTLGCDPAEVEIENPDTNPGDDTGAGEDTSNDETEADDDTGGDDTGSDDTGGDDTGGDDTGGEGGCEDSAPVLDFNGDGMSDLVLQYDLSGTRRWQARLSTGGSFDYNGDWTDTATEDVLGGTQLLQH